MDHIWTILMLRIMQAHLWLAFATNLKIDVIYVLYLESFCDKNLAVRMVLVFFWLWLWRLVPLHPPLQTFTNKIQKKKYETISLKY